jgi:hypothetical protein
MKRILLSVLVIGIILLGACSTPSKAPRISFEQDSVNLGEATPDQPIDYEFRFQNIGDAPLIVYGVTVKTLEGC